MFQSRQAYVEDFVKKLHEGQYIIDPKANDIQLGDGESLSKALGDALQTWEINKSTSISPPPLLSTHAFTLITLAFTHGIVIDKNDARDKVRETERLLEQCESEKSRLETDNKALQKRLAYLNQINETLENELKGREK